MSAHMHNMSDFLPATFMPYIAVARKHSTVYLEEQWKCHKSGKLVRLN